MSYNFGKNNGKPFTSLSGNQRISLNKQPQLLLEQSLLYILLTLETGGSEVKASACNAGDLGSIPGLGRSPGGGHGNSLQYSCLENPHGQRSLVGYSPWGLKESDTTEQLTLRCGR